MKKESRFHFSRAVIRPCLYMTFTRFPIALLVSLLLGYLITNTMIDIRQAAFTFFAVLFALMAWIAYLRLDGIHLPKFMMKRYNLRKKPVITYGDMIDHVDDEIVSFEELEDNEKDVCCLIADGIGCIAFLILALL